MQLSLPAAEFKSKQFHKILVVRSCKDLEDVEAAAVAGSLWLHYVWVWYTECRLTKATARDSNSRTFKVRLAYTRRPTHGVL